MFIYLFRDESESEHFAFSVDMTGANIPPIRPYTECVFLEAVTTLKFVEPWDIGGFRVDRSRSQLVRYRTNSNMDFHPEKKVQTAKPRPVATVPIGITNRIADRLSSLHL